MGYEGHTLCLTQPDGARVTIDVANGHLDINYLFKVLGANTMKDITYEERIAELEEAAEQYDSDYRDTTEIWKSQNEELKQQVAAQSEEIAHLLGHLKRLADISDDDISGKWVTAYNIRDRAREAIEANKKV